MVVTNGGTAGRKSATRKGRESTDGGSSVGGNKRVPAPPSLSIVQEARRKDVVGSRAKKDMIRSRSRSPGDLTRIPAGLVKRSVTPQVHKRTSSVTPNQPNRAGVKPKISPRSGSPMVPRSDLRGASASPLFIRERGGSSSAASTAEREKLLKELHQLKVHLAKVTAERDQLKADASKGSRRRGSDTATKGSRTPNGKCSSDPTLLKGIDKDMLSNFGIDFDDLTVDKSSVLGSGGFGTVYLGDYQATDVAVKIHRADKEWTEEELDVWKREVKIMTLLRHPNILMLLGAVFEKERLAIITEYCDEGTLQQMLYRKSSKSITVTWERKLHWLMQIAKGMAFLHYKRIFHRDLKSANVFVTGDTMKIADFGLSKLGKGHDERLASSLRSDSRNETSMIQGTFAFMAPEVWAEKAYSDECDVYSFGILIIELLSLDIPFERDFGDDCSWRIMMYRSRPKILTEVGGEPVPQGVQKLIEVCIREPEQRPPFTKLVSLINAEMVYRYAQEVSPWPNSKFDSWAGTTCSEWPSNIPDPLSVTTED